MGGRGRGRGRGRGNLSGFSLMPTRNLLVLYQECLSLQLSLVLGTLQTARRAVDVVHREFLCGSLIVVTISWNMDRCYSPSSSSSTQGGHGSGDHDQTPSSLRKRWLLRAREQRCRLYIMRRCIIMLLCWQKYDKC
ncbi:hypothetical protein NC652_010196 [Populus alba x Populus x berolinensis]|nr:hypothetical protein NC652_010196 [Populus alba x Populus x berolinensis]